MPANSEKLPKVLGDAAAAVVDAGNWLLFGNGEARGALLRVPGGCTRRGGSLCCGGRILPR